MIFFLIPLLVIGITEMMTHDSVVGGSILIALISVLVIAMFYWCYCMGGGNKVATFFENRKKRGEVAAAPTSSSARATATADESDKMLSDVGSDGDESSGSEYVDEQGT